MAKKMKTVVPVPRLKVLNAVILYQSISQWLIKLQITETALQLVIEISNQVMDREEGVIAGVPRLKVIWNY